MVGTADTKRELADGVGVSTRTVRNWLKREDWPFARRSPWDVQAVAAWRKENVRQGGPGRPAQDEVIVPKPFTVDGMTEREMKLVVQRERALKMRQEREIQAGTLVNAQERLEQELRALYALRAGILELGRSLASAICEVTGSTDRLAVQKVIDWRTRQLLLAFSKGWDGRGEMPTETEATP